MPNYVLSLRYENMDMSNPTPEVYQKMVSAVHEWSLTFKDKKIFSAKLKDNDGTTVLLKNGEYFLDGPFCETKEAISGIFVCNFMNKAEAEKIAKACPLLAMGGSVEIRSIEEMSET